MFKVSPAFPDLSKDWVFRLHDRSSILADHVHQRTLPERDQEVHGGLEEAESGGVGVSSGSA